MSSLTERINRVDRYFGDLYGHDRKRMKEIIQKPRKKETKAEVQEILWEIMPKGTILKDRRGEGEDAMFV